MATRLAFNSNEAVKWREPEKPCLVKDFWPYLLYKPSYS